MLITMRSGRGISDVMHGCDHLGAEQGHPNETVL